MLNKKVLITLIFAVYSIILAIPGILFSISWANWDIFQYWHSIDPGYFVLMMFAYLFLIIFSIGIFLIHIIDLKK